MPTQTQWVYAFGGGAAEGDASMRNLLGGKGANLAEMSALGLPVPPGFTITTEACNFFYTHEGAYPDILAAQVEAALASVEALAGKRFGDPSAPLLVSVRSGGRASMPGMMDTVLNLGLNDATTEGLAALAGNRRFALDSYRRFIQMYSAVVLGLDHHLFEEILDNHKDRLDVTVDTALTAEDWEKVVADYKAAVEEELGEPFPQDPKAQLWGAVGAVFASWMNERAKFYRRMHDIPESWGTAVNIQAMVFGNMGDSSATGVAFTRNPSTGENRLYGEFLINAQGEDVVAGIRTPQALTRAAREEMGDRAPSMEEALPEVFVQFRDVVTRLLAFKAKVLVFDPVVGADEIARSGAVAVASFDELLAHSDIVSPHCPSTPKTKQLFNAAAFAKMKAGSIFINVGRGDLVDSAAITAALQSGHLAGAALDVFDPEPIPADHPIRTMPNVILAAHIASASPPSVKTLRESAARIALQAVRGELPPNIVNGVTAPR